MMTNKLERLPVLVTVIVAVLAVAACAIRLRGDESETGSPASRASNSDPVSAKLEQCRTLKDDQNDVLLGCRKLWAEKRRQFFGRKSGALEGERGYAGSSSSAPPKDESRLPFGYPAIPAAQSE